MRRIKFSFSDCDHGFYGEQCEKKCGKCKSDAACNTLSGWCPDGCVDHWAFPYCTGNLVKIL